MKNCDEYSVLVYYDIPQVWLERWDKYAYLCYWVNTEYTSYVALRLQGSVVYGPTIMSSDIHPRDHFLIENDLWHPIKSIPSYLRLNFLTLQKSEEDQKLLDKTNRSFIKGMNIGSFGTATTILYDIHALSDQTTRTM